jgi:hypothetical protein
MDTERDKILADEYRTLLRAYGFGYSGYSQAHELVQAIIDSQPSPSIHIHHSGMHKEEGGVGSGFSGGTK